jgi:hypothetical protein
MRQRQRPHVLRWPKPAPEIHHVGRPARVGDDKDLIAKVASVPRRRFLRKLLLLAQATSSSRMRVSHSASLISALSTIFVSSSARGMGMVLTTTAPALVAASQQAIIAGLFAERIRNRLPGFTL